MEAAEMFAIRGKIDSEKRIYIAKELCEFLGSNEVVFIPQHRAVIMFSKNTPLEDVIISVRMLLKQLVFQLSKRVEAVKEA